MSGNTLIAGSSSCYTCIGGYKTSKELLTSEDPHSNDAGALDTAGGGDPGTGLARITDYADEKLWCYKEVELAAL